MSAALEAREVTRRYCAKAAVRSASLSLQPGEIACLLGPSGSGKSTLLRLLAGLEPVDEGEVWAGDRRLSGRGSLVAPEERDIGFVFQDYALFPHLTVEQNVAFGLRRLPAPERRARAMLQLERVRLADRAGAYPQALSGGEQQRVALARALAREPAAVLLDEPFSGLDMRLKAEVRDAALAALRAAGAAALIVTHDADDALLTADRLALMDGGRILQTGTPRELYLRPVSLAAAHLLGEADALPARVSAGVAETPFGRAPAPGVPDGAAVLMARPEAYRLGDGAEAEVASSRFAGGYVDLHLSAGGVMAHAHMFGAVAPAAGERVRVSLDPTFCAVFPA
ncbi:MAG TPA: ABC transporter ATP-binding protein [Caulobacteraceae bacterium]